MAKLGDDPEKWVEESYKATCENLGDFTPLTEHGCLTIAQCALLVPALFIDGKMGPFTDAAATFMKLAMLDIGKQELTARHPKTFLPWSEYLRMLKSGLYGEDGAEMPVPTANWLVKLGDVEKWLAVKGYSVNFVELVTEFEKTSSQSKASGSEQEESMPNAAKRKWENAELRKLLQEYNQPGMTLEKLGAQYGITRQAITKQLKRAKKIGGEKKASIFDFANRPPKK